MCLLNKLFSAAYFKFGLLQLLSVLQQQKVKTEPGVNFFFPHIFFLLLLSVFKRHLDNVLNNVLQLIISTEQVKQLD